MIELRRLEPPPARAPRPDAAPVGTCRCCGVRFFALPRRAAETRRILVAHEAICPGGSRAGEVVEPFGTLE